MTARYEAPVWMVPVLTALVAAALGLVAVVAPLVAIGGAAAIAFVSLVVLDLTAGVIIFTFTSFTEVLPGFGALSAAKLLGGVLVLSWLAASAAAPGARPRFGSKHRGIVVLGALLMAWVSAGLIWAEAPDAVIDALQRFGPNLLLFGIVYAGVREDKDLRRVLMAFVAGVLVSTVYGAFIAPADADAAAEGRISGAGVDPNELAAALVAGIAMCAFAVLTRGYAVAVRALAAVLILVLFFSLVVTASRTGIIALSSATACAVLFAGPGRRLPAAILAVVVLGLGAAYITQAAPQEARTRLQEFGNGSGRTDIWRVAERVARAHPVVGVGAGNFTVVSKHYLFDAGDIQRVDFIIDSPKVVHNLYLGLWAELGLVGLTIFMAIVAAAMRCGVQAAWAFHRAGDTAMELLSRSVIVATVALLAAGMFISMEHEKSLWILLALGPCLLRLGRAAEARAAP